VEGQRRQACVAPASGVMRSAVRVEVHDLREVRLPAIAVFQGRKSLHIEETPPRIIAGQLREQIEERLDGERSLPIDADRGGPVGSTRLRSRRRISEHQDAGRPIERLVVTKRPTEAVCEPRARRRHTAEDEVLGIVPQLPPYHLTQAAKLVAHDALGNRQSEHKGAPVRRHLRRHRLRRHRPKLGHRWSDLSTGRSRGLR
jgi:hypothetical protein